MTKLTPQPGGAAQQPDGLAQECDVQAYLLAPPFMITITVQE